MGTQFAGVLGFAEGTMGATVAAAGFSTMVSQASVSLIANKGDIGKVLEDLGSSESLRALATSMVTAGLTKGIATKLKIPTSPDGFVQQLKYNTLRGGVDIFADVAINNKNLGESLEHNIKYAGVRTLAGTVSNKIGESRKIGALTKLDGKDNAGKFAIHKGMHSAVGGLSSLALGGDFASGAIGAAVSETIAEATSQNAEQNALNKVNETAKKDGTAPTDKKLNDAYRAEMNKSANYGKLASIGTAFLAKKDIGMAYETSNTAIDNNSLHLLGLSLIHI